MGLGRSLKKIGRSVSKPFEKAGKIVAREVIRPFRPNIPSAQSTPDISLSMFSGDTIAGKEATTEEDKKKKDPTKIKKKGTAGAVIPLVAKTPTAKGIQI